MCLNWLEDKQKREQNGMRATFNNTPVYVCWCIQEWKEQKDA